MSVLTLSPLQSVITCSINQSSHRYFFNSADWETQNVFLTNLFESADFNMQILSHLTPSVSPDENNDANRVSSTLTPREHSIERVSKEGSCELSITPRLLPAHTSLELLVPIGSPTPRL